MKDIVDAKLKQAKLATKDDIADFLRKAYFDDKLKTINIKVTLNKTKNVLVQNELEEQQNSVKKLQTFDSSLFIGQSYFFYNGSQNFLMFSPILKIFAVPTGQTIVAWQS